MKQAKRSFGNCHFQDLLGGDLPYGMQKIPFSRHASLLGLELFCQSLSVRKMGLFQDPVVFRNMTSVDQKREGHLATVLVSIW